MAAEYFYQDLPVLDDFSAITDLSNYKKIPDDWQLIVADISDSTSAIRSGLYKAVNILGVSVITSIVNVARPLSIPYIFGGDGAILCIPPNLVPQASTALLATRIMANRYYGLNLRVGIIPIEIIHKAGLKVMVAKHRMSRYHIQAAFSGDGVEYAERLIKDEKAGAAYRLQATDDVPEADFSGLECRWDNVPSKHGEIIALIVKALATSIEAEAAIYKKIITRLQQIYGSDDVCRPVYSAGLRTTYDGSKLVHENRIRTFGQGKKSYILHWFKIRIQNALGWLFMTFGLRIGGTSWGDYKKDLVANTDFKKFDGVLRMVMSGTREQRLELTACLEQYYKNRTCVYGIHTSDSALITCLISKRSGYHYHFVDGAEGGYAMAAMAMKRQLKNLQ
jgi:hypothetical protein